MDSEAPLPVEPVATPFPRTTRQLKEALAALGIEPAKRHGQCFLTDVNAVDAIVRDAGVEPGDAVIEVGTGTGLLTHALCEAGAIVETFDLDPRVVGVAKGLRVWPARVRFHVGDALDGKHALAAELVAAFARARGAVGPGRVRFVSNLPYNAGTPIVLGVLGLADPPDALTVMIQLEMAEKFLAAAGAHEFGVPSILRALRADGRVLRRFPPDVFWPRPSVRSALLSLSPRRPPDLLPGEDRPLGAFLVALFTRRRKVLTTALRAAVPTLSGEDAVAACARVGLDPRIRPEDAGPLRLRDLWRATIPPA